jgi:O-methyltransferase
MDLKSEYLKLLKLSLIDALGHEIYYGVPNLSGTRRDVNTLPLEQIERRLEGTDWPSNGMTMIGLKRLDNLQACIEDVVTAGVPGDLIETGVWRGGAAIFMRAMLRVLGVEDRCVWAADSFEGLPAPDPDRYPIDAGSKAYTAKFLAVSLEDVKRHFEQYGMLDDQVRFVKGWFRDTLPTLRSRQWSLIRLDGDLYESTMVALESLYPGLSPGGYVIIDDYSLRRCRRAVDDYRERNGVSEEICQIDWTGVYWQKQGERGRRSPDVSRTGTDAVIG